MAGNSKSSSSKSKTSSKSKSSSASKTKAQKAAERQEMARRQIWAVVLFAAGLLLFFISVIKGQNFWLILHNLMFGLFGWCGYLMGPLSIYIAFMIATEKTSASVRATLIEAAALICLLCGITQVFGAGTPAAGGL